MAKKFEPYEPNRPEQEEGGVIVVDILGEELKKGLPHWLDPIEKFKGKHDEKRRQKRIEHSNKIQGR